MLISLIYTKPFVLELCSYLNSSQKFEGILYTLYQIIESLIEKNQVKLYQFKTELNSFPPTHSKEDPLEFFVRFCDLLESIEFPIDMFITRFLNTTECGYQAAGDSQIYHMVELNGAESMTQMILNGCKKGFYADCRCCQRKKCPYQTTLISSPEIFIVQSILYKHDTFEFIGEKKIKLSQVITFEMMIDGETINYVLYSVILYDHVKQHFTTFIRNIWCEETTSNRRQWYLYDDRKVTSKLQNQKRTRKSDQDLENPFVFFYKRINT